jgi:hypothetical protein
MLRCEATSSVLGRCQAGGAGGAGIMVAGGMDVSVRADPLRGEAAEERQLSLTGCMVGKMILAEGLGAPF